MRLKATDCENSEQTVSEKSVQQQRNQAPACRVGSSRSLLHGIQYVRIKGRMEKAEFGRTVANVQREEAFSVNRLSYS